MSDSRPDARARPDRSPWSSGTRRSVWPPRPIPTPCQSDDSPSIGIAYAGLPAGWALSPPTPTAWRAPGSARAQRTGHFDPEAWPDEPVDFGMSPGPRSPRLRALPAGPGPLRRAARCRLGGPHGARRRAHRATALQIRRCRRPARRDRRPRWPRSRAPRACCSSTTIGARPSPPGPTACIWARKTWMTLSLADLAEIRDAGLRLGLSTHGYAEMLRADRPQPELHRPRRRVPDHAQGHGHPAPRQRPAGGLRPPAA